MHALLQKTLWQSLPSLVKLGKGEIALTVWPGPSKMIERGIGFIRKASGTPIREPATPVRSSPGCLRLPFPPVV
jgi:hypothetical protein